MNNITELELAWLAGLLEGEGCFSHKSSNAMYINCSMTDEDIIRKIESIIGEGSVTTYQKPDRKRVWTWRTGNRRTVIDLCKLLLPYMGERRSAKIQEMIDYDLANPKKRQEKGKVQHGTRTMYSSYGCRCEHCKAAEAYYYSNERKK